MKGSLVAAAAVLVGSASAHLNHRHAAAHKLFEKRDNEVCTTFVTTIYGEMTWVPTPAPKPTTSSAFVNTTSFVNSTACITTTSAILVPVTTITPSAVPTTTSTSTSTPAPTTTTTKTTSSTSTITETPCTVPTIAVETCPTPGVYTFPATTVVVTETTTVCGGSTTSVPAGTHTLGGVTTIVETATTVVCPYATTSSMPGGVVTSIIETTTYVCPSAGTYTIAPITTTCETDVVVVVPVVTTFVPATYTRPAVITTVVETDVVVYCPFAIPTTLTVPATTSTTAPAPVVTTTEKPATTVQPATTVTPVATTTKSTASPTATKPASGGKLGTSGNKWAITYTPYTESGSCKAASAVLEDLTEIAGKGFTTVRVYSTDCDTLPSVGAACEKLGLKMIIGVFIGEVGCDNGNPDVQAQIAAIKAWGKWDLVELAVVGNEAGNNGYCTPAQLKALIVEVKELITEAGCDVPVTTTDTVNTWQNEEFSAAICSVVDVVACNAHGYFNAETAPSDAGKFVQGQLDIVKSICGLEGYVMETGWPSVCVPNGLATCSTEDQAQAIEAIQSVVGGEVVFFSYSDDTWKDDGSCGCEQHWGCGQLF